MGALISDGYVLQGDVVGLEDSLAQLADGEACTFTNGRGTAYYKRPSFTGINPVVNARFGNGNPVIADEATIKANSRDIILGQEDRGSDNFVALEFVVYTIEAEALVQKVKSPWRSPAMGRPLDITLDQAQRALDAWRVQFVEKASGGSFSTHSTSNAFSSEVTA